MKCLFLLWSLEGSSGIEFVLYGATCTSGTPWEKRKEKKKRELSRK